MCHSDYNASHTINERLSERSSLRSSMITACSTALLGRIATGTLLINKRKAAKQTCVLVQDEARNQLL